jgi:hypothetical protein
MKLQYLSLVTPMVANALSAACPEAGLLIWWPNLLSGKICCAARIGKRLCGLDMIFSPVWCTVRSRLLVETGIVLH